MSFRRSYWRDLKQKSLVNHLLETNRKFKLTISLIALTVMLFVVPETTTAFYNLQVENDNAALVLEEGEVRPPPVLLQWHLLNAATFGTLLASLITVYLGANVAQKVWVEPPTVLGQPSRPGERPYPGEVPEGE